MGSAARRGRPSRILDIVGAAVAALLAFTAVPAVLVAGRRQPAGGRPRPRLAAAAPRRAVPSRRWRPGWPGRPAARSCSERWWRTCAAARSGCARARRSSIAWRRASHSACSPSRRSARPSRSPAGAGASTPVGGRRPRRLLAHGGTSRPAPRRRRRRTSAPTYAVQPGDTLWRIADDLLGDGADWTSLAALNLGRDLGGGARFVDPDQLREGWRLRLPADVDRPAGDDAARAGHARPRRRTGHAPEPDGHLPELDRPRPRLAWPAPPWPGAPRRRRRVGRALHRRSRSSEPVAVGGGTGRGDPAAALQRCPGAPFLRGRQLPAGPVPATAAASGPTVRAICVSASGVTFCFAGVHPDEPPEGFVRVKDDTAWHVEPRCPRGPRPFLPVPARRASHRRRRRGDLARPARARRRAARPR